MDNQAPKAADPVRSSIALSCPKPSAQAVLQAHAEEHRRIGFTFCDSDKRADFVAAYPELDAVCERIGFGWAHSVRDWSADTRWVMNELARGARPPVVMHNNDLRSASLSELVEHLLVVYHRPLRLELNRLMVLIRTLANAHPHHEDIQALANGFTQLRDSLLIHLSQEELEAFPLCVDLENQHRHLNASFDRSHAEPLHFMAAGHLETTDDLKRLRELTQRANVSHDPDAILVVQGLIAMHDALLMHTMIENEILLPAALFACELLVARRAREPISSGLPPTVG